MSVAIDDGLPQHVCMKCVRRVETLEKALKDLEEFRSLACKSYDELSLSSSRKRSKDSSGASATPDTIKSRPPAKKSASFYSSRRLDFGQELTDITNIQGMIIIVIIFASLDMHFLCTSDSGVQDHDASTLAGCDHVSDSSPLQSCIPDRAGMSSSLI